MRKEKAGSCESKSHTVKAEGNRKGAWGNRQSSVSPGLTNSFPSDDIRENSHSERRRDQLPTPSSGENDGEITPA